MKYLIRLTLLLPLFAVQTNYAQNSPLSIWGGGLDGSTYQQTAIYSEYPRGLMIEGPLDANGNRLPIEFNWRGGNNTALKILPNKYVGIGTANPDHILTVRGENATVDIQSTADGQRPGLSMRYQNSSSAGSNIYYYTADANTYFDNLYSNTAGTNYGSFNFRSRDEQSQLTSRLFLNGQNGNVGIGTSTPATKLEVITSTDYDQLSLTKNTVEGDKGSGIIFRNRVDDGSITDIGGIQVRLKHGGTGFISGSLSLYTKYNSSKVEAVTINPQGDMGIGTLSPTEKLAVNGKIRAKEIKVEASNWPDYIFEEGYKVGSLEELESYIKTNKRLPEMPAAKEIETNGLMLGEVVKLQQKKIEELTLHLIEKDKELRSIAAKQKEMETLLKKLVENK